MHSLPPRAASSTLWTFEARCAGLLEDASGCSALRRPWSASAGGARLEMPAGRSDSDLQQPLPLLLVGHAHCSSWLDRHRSEHTGSSQIVQYAHTAATPRKYLSHHRQVRGATLRLTDSGADCSALVAGVFVLVCFVLLWFALLWFALLYRCINQRAHVRHACIASIYSSHVKSPTSS